MLVYGERPITEFIIGLAGEKELKNMIEEITFLDATKIDLKENLEKVYVEAPLGGDVGYIDILFLFDSFCFLCEVKPEPCRFVKDRLKPQLQRYYEFIKNLETKSNAKLVKRVIKKIKRKDRYLISITKDDKFPKSLKNLIEENDWNESKIGWISYKQFETIAENNGYKIEGSRSHIWLEYKK